MGLRDIERKMRTKSSYQRKEAELLLQELDQMIENLEVLKEQLKKFEKDHKKDIETNQEYYQKIGTLRDELGLPREVGVYEWKDSPSLKDKLTTGAFYRELANDILMIGRERIKTSGGILSLAEIIIELNKNRPGKLVDPNDVTKSLSILEENGLIQKIRTLESGVKVIEFVSIELSDDQQTVLDLASRKGFATPETVIIQTNWSPERTNNVLSEMEKSGLAIRDEQVAEGIKYWFPGLTEY